jgi:hypothetical protein
VGWGGGGGGDMGKDVAKVLKNSGFVKRHDAIYTLYIFSSHSPNKLRIYLVAQHKFALLCNCNNKN